MSALLWLVIVWLVLCGLFTWGMARWFQYLRSKGSL
jgi:hypothetical protein